MEFNVYRTWDYENAQKIEFSTLEELLEFTKQKQEEKESVTGLIISYSKDGDCWMAEIYDGYRE